MGPTITLHVRHAFLYGISLPSTHDLSVKHSSVTFYRGRKHSTANVPFSFLRACSHGGGGPQVGKITRLAGVGFV